MRRCNYVQFYDGFPHPDLEKAEEKNHFKLNEIEGVIDFCEFNEKGLVIKLSDHYHPDKTNEKTILWKFDKEVPLPAVCEQGLRCFYEQSINPKKDSEIIFMLAYELLDKASSKMAIRRGICGGDKPKRYKFIDFD